MEACRSWLIRRSEPWDFRPTALWSPFGSQARRLKRGRHQHLGSTDTGRRTQAIPPRRCRFDWSPDGSRLAYHTPGPGDPLFVSEGNPHPGGQPIFTAPAGLHSHFPLWSSDAVFVYFVRGSLPDKLDIWRIPAAGGTPERITSQDASVSYPVLFGRHTLMYLASDPDGSGPWLYSMDINRRIPIGWGLALNDTRRWQPALTVPVLRLRWQVPGQHCCGCELPIRRPEVSTADPILLTTGMGFSPRLGPNYLLYFVCEGHGREYLEVC